MRPFRRRLFHFKLVIGQLLLRQNLISVNSQSRSNIHIGADFRHNVKIAFLHDFQRGKILFNPPEQIQIADISAPMVPMGAGLIIQDMVFFGCH